MNRAELNAARSLAQRLDDVLGGAPGLESELQAAMRADDSPARLRDEALRAPTDPLPRVLLLRALVDRGQFAAARLVERELPSTPEVVPMVRPWRGILALADGNLDQAEPLLRAELAAGPEVKISALALARAFVALEFQGEALAVLAAGSNRRPDDDDLQLATAEVERDLFLRDDAEHHLRALLQRNPAREDARCCLAELLYEQGRFEECRATLETLPLRPQPASAVRRDRLLENLTAAAGDGARAVSVRSLLAAVRGAPLAQDRESALRALATSDETRALALRAAFRHGDGPLRALAAELTGAPTNDAATTPPPRDKPAEQGAGIK